MNRAGLHPERSLQKLIVPSLMQSLVQLRSKERSITGSLTAQADPEALRELLKEAEDIDTSFSRRAESNPVVFRPYSQHSVLPASTDDIAFAPEKFYIYVNIHSAFSWLRFRSLRLLVLSTMLRISSLLEALEGTNDPAPQRVWAEQRILDIVDDSCASHAYCFDYAETNAAKISRDGVSCFSFMRIIPEKNNLAWDLIETFQLACTFACVPPATREWMKGHINAFLRRLEIVA